MEWCPYCQRWVEPVKGNWDLALGTLVGGLPGLIAGGAYHVIKGARCPICNNLIKGTRTRPPIPPPVMPRMAPVYPRDYAQAPSAASMPFPHPGPSQSCPYCQSSLVWEPHIGQWYCPYCRILPFQTPPVITRL